MSDKEAYESVYTCEWTDTGYGFMTECQSFYEISYDVVTTGFKYCPYCGNNIKFIYKWQGK